MKALNRVMATLIGKPHKEKRISDATLPHPESAEETGTESTASEI